MKTKLNVEKIKEEKERKRIQKINDLLKEKRDFIPELLNGPIESIQPSEIEKISEYLCQKEKPLYKFIPSYNKLSELMLSSIQTNLNLSEDLFSKVCLYFKAFAGREREFSQFIFNSNPNLFSLLMEHIKQDSRKKNTFYQFFIDLIGDNKLYCRSFYKLFSDFGLLDFINEELEKDIPLNQAKLFLEMFFEFIHKAYCLNSFILKEKIKALLIEFKGKEN
ncbi:MAG: hypothetical protein MJ252_10520, partial [archaeon]|nr:hypothetical protein [archaeon]